MSYFHDTSLWAIRDWRLALALAKREVSHSVTRQRHMGIRDW
ncbi:hypothetical protein [Mastigocoleus sp. MO_188.B34]|nr:hypothetical protein [Mastigocoleus sp. MO_188.B34]